VDGMMPKFLLLVTHDPAIAQLNFMEFYEAGFVLYSTGSLQEATTLLQQRPIDLLLVDLQSQEKEAIQFCQKAKAANARLKAGFLVAQDQPLPAESGEFLVMQEQFRGNALQELRSALERMSGAA
jgi:CheY-like chemotaxis protein